MHKVRILVTNGIEITMKIITPTEEALEKNGYKCKKNTENIIKLKPDGWILCCSCDKWRRVDDDTLQKYSSKDMFWLCDYNTDKYYNQCKIEQEKTNKEINDEIEQELILEQSSQLNITENEVVENLPIPEVEPIPIEITQAQAHAAQQHIAQAQAAWAAQVKAQAKAQVKAKAQEQAQAQAAYAAQAQELEAASRAQQLEELVYQVLCKVFDNNDFKTGSYLEYIMISSQKIQNIINGEHNKFEKMKTELNIQEDRIKKMDSNITDIIDSTVCFIFRKSKEMCPTLKTRILDICVKQRPAMVECMRKNNEKNEKLKRDRNELEKEKETLKRNREELEKEKEEFENKTDKFVKDYTFVLKRNREEVEKKEETLKRDREEFEKEKEEFEKKTETLTKNREEFENEKDNMNENIKKKIKIEFDKCLNNM